MVRSLSLILPVRNVQASLRGLIGEVLEIAAELTSRFEVLILDLGSKDETPETADELSRRYPQVGLLRQPAAADGGQSLTQAIDSTRGEILFVRDEPGQLNLHDLPKLWAQIDDYDCLIGRPRQSATLGIRRPMRPVRSWVQRTPSLPLARTFQMFHRQLLEQIDWPQPTLDALAGKLLAAGCAWQEVEVRTMGGEPPAPADSAVPMPKHWPNLALPEPYQGSSPWQMS